MKEPKAWITVNGNHVPIFEGESKKDAIKRWTDRRNKIDRSVNANLDLKERQLVHGDNIGKILNTQNDEMKEVDAKNFAKSIKDARESRPVEDRWRVDAHSPDDYKDAKCYVSKYGSTVAVRDNGDIISVCKHYNDSTRGMGNKLMQHAIKNGGNKLDSFSGNHAFYVKNGFEPVSWTPFSKKYAPAGWKESGAPEEPVIFYKYVGVGKVKNTEVETWLKATKPYTGDTGYDAAYAYRDKQLRRNN